ncbi:MAG TPA: FecR domain-containing protein, partial [Polyangiaceae bacterium]
RRSGRNRGGAVSDEVTEFGRALGRALGNGPPPATLGVQRANLMAAAHRLGRRRSRPRWELAFALAAGVAAAAFGAAWYRGHVLEAAALSARWNGEQIREDSELSVLARMAPLEFSDGSQMVFDASSHAKLEKLTSKRASVRLDHGRFVASIHHHDGMTWGIDAGPYLVEVIGTKFSVDWQKGSSSLRVDVTEGTVRVSGGDLGPSGVALAAGQHLERGLDSTPARPKPAAEPKATAQPSSQESEESEERPPAAANVTAREPSLGALASAGKYREALELAEKRGFERVISELGENDLLLLANSARYSGAQARAKQALLKLRERFPGRPSADLAALYLARIAEQSEHRPAEAVRWLRTFLSESPTGDLAQSARGSLLSILSAQGDTAGARAVARDYLRYHPEGPLAEQARSLVSRTTPP